VVQCTCEIKSRIAMAKGAFNKKKNLFMSKLDLKYEFCLNGVIIRLLFIIPGF
jgi:hypothetical protein